jgi:predicted signal transduction protein with EAL and GGDEF domain
VVPAATTKRRLVFAIAITSYAVVFTSFVLFEVPGLGLGHFFYIPVALVAVSLGARGGFLGGAIAAALYALAIIVAPHVPTGDVLTYGTGIRFVTFTSCGALVGWFADEHRHHLEQLRDLAERDFLTGILNTRVFDEALSRRCDAGRPFLLLLGDMDNLKVVNDTHGHTAGNAELRRLADVLGQAIRPDDELARVGGDECRLDGRECRRGGRALPHAPGSPRCSEPADDVRLGGARTRRRCTARALPQGRRPAVRGEAHRP